MNILTLNSGSSSIKFKLIQVESHEVLAKGVCERIGLSKGQFSYEIKGGPSNKELSYLPDHNAAAQLIFDLLFKQDAPYQIDGFAHRVVMGGYYFNDAVIIDYHTIDKIRELAPLAPLHNYPAASVIEACMSHYPSLSNVAIFDTAFHTTIPDKSSDYALPRDIIEKFKIKRYGAHGISHRFVSMRVKEYFDNADELKILSAHIGNGASLCAIKHGDSVNTTMGFTPLEGLVMGTRCGSIDPAIVTYILENSSLSASELNEIMNQKSGLLGLSGLSSDLRDIAEEAHKGNTQCQHAIEAYSHSVKCNMGSMVFSMGGCDVLAFTAGVGENSAIVRTLACSGLEELGFIIDEEKNQNAAIGNGEISVISAPESQVQILVIPTNEELMMAMDAKRLLYGYQSLEF